MNRSEPAFLSVYNDIRLIALPEARQLWIARELGALPLIANAEHVRVVDGGIEIASGLEILSPHETMVFATPRRITRGIAMHRRFMDTASDHLFAAIATKSRCLVSYLPAWKHLSCKWDAEVTFRRGDDFGLRVPRPTTYLVSRYAIRSIEPIARRCPLIYKPVGGFECNGILLSRPGTFEAIAKKIETSPPQRYVVQKFPCEPVLLNGHRFDLRIFVLVTSFRPIRFHIPRRGIAKIAARPSTSDTPDDLRAVLTGSNYRRLSGLSVDDLTISEVLDLLKGNGFNTEDFWDQLDDLMRLTLTCMAMHPALDDFNAANSFYLAGVDILLTSNRKQIVPLFLESNYAPSLNEWGAKLDTHLENVHREWLQMLLSIVTSRS
jgi:hypothetical protein